MAWSIYKEEFSVKLSMTLTTKRPRWISQEDYGFLPRPNITINACDTASEPNQSIDQSFYRSINQSINLNLPKMRKEALALPCPVQPNTELLTLQIYVMILCHLALFPFTGLSDHQQGCLTGKKQQ